MLSNSVGELPKQRDKVEGELNYLNYLSRGNAHSPGGEQDLGTD